jgi:hypothetical protein
MHRGPQERPGVPPRRRRRPRAAALCLADGRRHATRYRYVRGEDGARVQVDLLTRGEDHRRMSSPLLGLGWLIYPTEWRDPLRWEGDDGKRLPFDVVTYQAGDAAYIAESARVEKSRKRDKVWPQLEGEAARWMRLTMRDGTSMDFRRDQP